MKHLRYGVEIEMVGLTAASASRIVLDYFDGEYDHWDAPGQS